MIQWYNLDGAKYSPLFNFSTLAPHHLEEAGLQILGQSHQIRLDLFNPTNHVHQLFFFALVVLLLISFVR